MSDLPKSARTADEPVYLGESRHSEPKEMFKLVARLIAEEGRQCASLVDVGCATGEFLHFATERFPDFRLTGIDVSEAMLAHAREMVPTAAFRRGSVTEPAEWPELATDVITCIGVLTIIDDVAQALTNLAAALKPGGSLYVFNAINPDPIDVLVRYRPSGEDGPWELGRNLHSKATMEAALRRAVPGISLAWHPFDIGMVLARREDPMRTWTLRTEAKAYQLINGACQLVNLECLQARKPG